MLDLLLVEDNRNDYVLVANALRSHDFEEFNITRVGRLDEAVDIINRESFDLVISDLNLPDSSATNTVCALGQYADRFPVVVLSSITDQRVAQMAISTGIEDYFVKDYLSNTELLHKTIDFSLERHRIKSQLNRARSEHEHYATHDIVCNIPNRLLFIDRLNRAIAQSERYGDSLALVFIDLDDFKPVNDGLGHDAGDYLLSSVARRIKDQIRESDTIARIGGDEFAVLLPRCEDALNLDQLLQQIKRVVSEPVIYQSLTCSVSASIGVARFPKDADSRHNLMHYADLAMFEAKSQGGNRIRYFRETMADTRQRRRQLENDLREALDKKELGLSYQPVTQFDDDSLYGVEVLLHWPRSGQTDVMYHRDILQVAIDSRLTVRLGHYMLDKLSQDMERLVQSGTKRLLINSSIAQLRHNGFVDALAEIAQLWSSFGRECYVEIAEAEATEDIKSVVAVINKMKKKNIKTILDHFGAGQASLSHIKSRDLAVDAVKIDGSYICEGSSDKRDKSVLRAIINLIHDLGLDCIALGVETAKQDVCIRELGCSLAQGRFYKQNISLCDLPRQDDNIALLEAHR